MLRLALLLALLTAAPVRAQSAEDFSDVTPEAVLAQTWAEALGGAEAVAWALDDVAAPPDTSLAPAADASAHRRAAQTAATAAAATAATVGAVLPFSLALADPAERATLYAALGEDALALHGLLVLVAEEPSARPRRHARTLRPARSGRLDAPAGSDAPAERWDVRAAQIRQLAGRLGGALAALGLTGPAGP